MAAINEIKKPKIHLAVFSTDKRVITGIQNLAEGFNHEGDLFSYTNIFHFCQHVPDLHFVLIFQ